MKKIFNIKIGFFAILAVALTACKAPMATVTQDKVKEQMPAAYSEKPPGQNSSIVPWKEFFTDPHLTKLIDTALVKNQDLLITIQKIEMAKSDVLYRSGRLYPTVSGGAGVGVKKAGRYTSEGAGDASTEMQPGKRIPDLLGNFNVGLSADWEVDIWHKLRTEKQAAVDRYLASVEGKNFVYSSLIAEVAGNYYELLALDNQLEIIRQYTVLQKKALDISKIQKQAAATTELAVKKFEAELAKSNATEYTLKQQIVEKENEINMLLGRYPQPVERDKSAFMSLVPKTVYSGVPAELLTNRPDIKQAELELQAAKLDVEAARKEFYPKLNISAALGLEAFKPTYLLKIPASVATGLMGGLTAPLINKSAITAQFKSADAAQISALYEYDKTILNAYISVANLLSKIKNIDDYYVLKKKQSDALDESINYASLLFANARADYLEVLMTQRDALDAKMELMEAKQMQLSSVIDVYKNLGGGWK